MGKPIRVIGTRGDIIETEHHIIYAVVQNGKVIDSGGDIRLNRAMRSSAKPIQALVCIESGAADAFKLTETELAIIASSHEGTDMQTRTVDRVLRKCGLSQKHLQCGAEPPIDMAVYQKLLLSGRKPQRIHHNCSGKHSGILASCRHMGWPISTYRSPDHPWNRRAFELVAMMAGISVSKVSYAIDGCGIPVIFVSIRDSALAFARYSSPEGLPEPIADGARRIARAVNRHPVLNSGRKRFLAALYKAAPGRFVAKEGGQGVFSLGVLGAGMGIALKSLGGMNYAYPTYEAAALLLLERHGLLNKKELKMLHDYSVRPILNSRKEVVGNLSVSE